MLGGEAVALGMKCRQGVVHFTPPLRFQRAGRGGERCIRGPIAAIVHGILPRPLKINPRGDIQKSGGIMLFFGNPGVEPRKCFQIEKF